MDAASSASPGVSGFRNETMVESGATLHLMARRLSSMGQAVIAGAVLSFATCGAAAELRIAAPNAVKEVMTEAATAHRQGSVQGVMFTWSGSEAISKRIAEGEAFDVVVNTAQGIDRMVRDGKLLAGTRVEFARSGVGMAVRGGALRPDVSTVDALRRALLDANSIAISSGASGRYLEGLFRQLGIADQIQSRIRQPPSGAQIGEMIARGEAEFGFQQITELIHAKGIEYLGPLPVEVQNHTIWSAAVLAATQHPDAAREFIGLLRTPESLQSIRKSGMDPM